eukprot:CAMPEP_0113873810 /NCGR_PEP_ID=MMETSP0780_2-20120614/3981_1 /TAXON_ID=652834 /ORGANISM="Palpitomonas bilix" /LENGTH=423 /DNA_ID=CAMNT_0000859505 /DNA_START=32 /DNA_END=1303 /DNA_ORIENTATION=- /assembly_acc=CAM_ASM_000599
MSTLALAASSTVQRGAGVGSRALASSSRVAIIPSFAAGVLRSVRSASSAAPADGASAKKSSPKKILQIASSEVHTHGEKDIGKVFEVTPQLLDDILPEFTSTAVGSEWKDIHDCVHDTSRGRHLVVTQSLHEVTTRALASFDSDTHTRVIVKGDRGVGKSAALLAAALACRQAGKCVIYIPSAKELVNATSLIMHSGEVDAEGKVLYDTPELATYLLNRLKASEDSRLHLVPSTNEKLGVTLSEVIEKGLADPRLSSAAIAQVFEALSRTKAMKSLFVIDDLQSLMSLTLYKTPLGPNDDAAGFIPKRIPPRQLTVLRPLVDLLEEDAQTSASIIAADGSHAKLGVYSRKECEGVIEITEKPAAAGFDVVNVEPMTFSNVYAKLLYLKGVGYIYMDPTEELAKRMHTVTSGYPGILAKYCRAF